MMFRDKGTVLNRLKIATDQQIKEHQDGNGSTNNKLCNAIPLPFVYPSSTQDMTRDEIASEKVALQKSLLYYESIHGRPVSIVIFVSNGLSISVNAIVWLLNVRTCPTFIKIYKEKQQNGDVDDWLGVIVNSNYNWCKVLR